MIRKKIIVHGRVQGVGFRYHVYQQALLIGIRGWVKNCSDGTVAIDAEGTEPQMKRFIEAVKKGSPASKVTDMDIQDEEPIGFKEFEIRF